jgi:hypothetical protein
MVNNISVVDYVAQCNHQHGTDQIISFSQRQMLGVTSGQRRLPPPRESRPPPPRAPRPLEFPRLKPPPENDRPP